MSQNTQTSSSVKKTVGKAAGIGVIALAIMNIATIVSLRGLPAEAKYGYTSAFYYVFAAVFFLLPVAMVAAELATAWPKKGGVFRWMGEAFGPRWGFLAIYLQWLATTIWFPTVLIFAAVALAFLGPNQTWDEALAANKLYTVLIVLVVYWISTLITFRGIKSAAKLTTLGGLIGTIIPAALLIICGIIYMVSGNPLQMHFSWSQMIPDFSNFNNLVLASSIFLFFAGMEIQAVHIKDVRNPTRNYPLGVILATIVIVLIFVLGTIAIGVVIPNTQINLVQSLLISYNDFFRVFGFGWFGIVIAAALAFGVLGQVTAIVAGPSTGLLQVGKAGYLPPFFQKTNKHGIQTRILLIQGTIVSVLAIVLVVLPSVQAAYQILGQLASILYLIMYLMLFTAAMRLRIKEPDTPRPFKVPGGKIGLWIFGIIGFIGSLFAFILSFIPPSQISIGSPLMYVLILVVGTVIFVALPFIIYAKRKPNWKTATGADAFEPFDWELKAKNHLTSSKK